MSATEIEHDTDLSTFDVPDIPCGYVQHDIYGTGAAVWVVTHRNPLAHGCVLGDGSNPRVKFFCDGCWTRFWSLGGWVVCLRCRTQVRIQDDLLSAERIR